MKSRNLKTFFVIILVLLMATSGLPSLFGSSDSDGELAGGGMGFFDVSPWMDAFDDSSKVNFTQNTVVTSGHVELAAGQGSGLVASEGIFAPPGYRYDLLVVEVDTPGTSSAKISVLNATEDSAIVGYVNQPIPGFLKLDKTQVPLSGVGAKAFPEIRLQADLEAAGLDRPTVLKWTVFFISGDMWRDDFLGDGKVDEFTKVNFTGDAVEVDMSKQNTYAPGYGNYEKLPTIFVGRYSDQTSRTEMGVFYANAGKTDYQGRTQLYAENVRGYFAGDVDQDGYIDMVVANQRNGGDYTRDSWIMWGDVSGTYDTARVTNLATNTATDPALGDVDGDGWLDVLICTGGGAGEVRIFLNPKSRAFSGNHDISLPGQDISGLASLDLNSDGYDDVILAEEFDSSGDTWSRTYFGGPSGPDTTADKMFKTGGSVYEVALDDFDRDGNVDIVFANTVDEGAGDRAFMYYGGEDGPDETPDFKVEVDGSQWGITVATGDINGDGWPEIVFGRVEQNPNLYVWWGGPSGFSNANEDHPDVDGSNYDLIIIDVNKDGYDDVIGCDSWGGDVYVYLGAASGLNGDSDFSMGSNAARPLGVVADKNKFDFIQGSFITKPINRAIDKKWDILVMDANIPPQTELEITVLDNAQNPVLGYESLVGPDVDLSGVDVPTIHIRVTLRSNDMVSTPSVNSMFIKWMDKNVWREEYYGKAKISNLQGFDVIGGQMVADNGLAGEEEIIFSNMRNDGTYNVDSVAYRDTGGLNYLSATPIRFRVPSGAADVKVADLNGDGFSDLLFPVTQTSDSNFIADSPVFFGSSVGFDTVPDHRFPTIGARDAVVSDLNMDGFMDVVFAQEKEATNDYLVNSTLFWGSATGWNATADLQIGTTGATGVVAVDVNKDGLDDLVFSCFRDGTTTATDSMAFYQTSSGFDGTSPDMLFPTRGARGVAAGDIDGNGWVDLVFANSLSGGFVDIFSFVYWGESSGFAISPTNLPTHGAEGVTVAKLNGDTHMDVVFACSINNSQSRAVDSFVYLGDGTRSIGPSADFALPTLGATSVAVADLDGTGWSDLVFSCENDGATYEVNSRVFLGGASGYGSGPDIELPTNGASGVAVAHVIAKDGGGYLTKVISPDEPVNAGVFETFKYNVISLPAGHTGTIQVLDATTGELLAETALMAGANEWSLADKFRIREHEAIRIMIVVDGLDPGAGFAIDDLWLNWSPRNRAPPMVLGLEVSDDNVLRTHSIDAIINVTDEYDFLNELSVKLEHRMSGSSDPWVAFMVTDLGFRTGSWRASIGPRVDIPVGVYDLRVMVTDSDKQDSGWKLYTEMYEVLNNLPTAPQIHIDPVRATTTTELTAEFDILASDIESPGLTYHYTWYLDGVLVPDLTMDQVPFSYLTRGQNWSVEVRAFDGDDEGPAALAWKLIVNARPLATQKLVPPELMEDTSDDRWTDLSTAFGDPDGDVLTYRVDPPASYFTVDIDQETGVVTYTPEANWWGTEEITFWASDGEFEVNQTVLVNVLPVNDPAFFITVAGRPFTPDDIYLEVDQDGILVIEVLAFDVEGDDLLFRVTTNQVTLDLSNGWLTFSPTNDNVGWLNFSLSVNDNIDLDDKMWANFTVLVLNINDPVDIPRIISPSNDATYKWNESVGLRGVCTDPDTEHGQELVYLWSSNISGDLGFGQDIYFRFLDSGTHQITLTVSDGEFSKQHIINITVSAEPLPPPPPPPPPDDTGLSMTLLIGIVVAIVVALLIAFLVVKRRNAAMEEPIPLTEEEKKRHHLEKMAVAVKETADQWEAERDAGKANGASDNEKIAVTGTGMVPSDDAAHKMRLTESASAETAKLWSDMGAGESIVDDAEKDALRKETEMRKVQSAIQALPYGIPAPALRHIQPQMLAEEVANGSKNELPDGSMIVSIRGKWYYSDPENSSNFLMPYVEKVEPKPSEPSTEGSEWEEA